MKYLERLAKEYGTDKYQHGYMDAYAQCLPDKINSMLEIGYYHGSSAKMWREIYGESVKIHVLDLFENPENAMEEDAIASKFITHKGDQSSLPVLHSITEQFDLIIDDGSHRADHQLISFIELFRRNLKPGGLYVCEDLHCCTEEFYRGTVKSQEDTMLIFIENIEEARYFANNFLILPELKYLKHSIDKVKLFNRKIGFIWKKI